MENLQKQVTGQRHFGNDSTILFLVRACRYNEVIHAELSRGRKSVLVTFGDTSVPQSRKTYRCLERLLASVLLRELGDLVAEDKGSILVSGASASATKFTETSRVAEITRTTPLSAKENANAAAYRNLRVLMADDNLVNQVGGLWSASPLCFCV